MADYIYVPGKGTVLLTDNGPAVVGNEFINPQTLAAQVKAPKEVTFDVRPEVLQPTSPPPPDKAPIITKAPVDVLNPSVVRKEESSSEVKPIEIIPVTVATPKDNMIYSLEEKSPNVEVSAKQPKRKVGEIQVETKEKIG
jgi:hypothetical protein